MYKKEGIQHVDGIFVLYYKCMVLFHLQMPTRLHLIQHRMQGFVEQIKTYRLPVYYYCLRCLWAGMNR